MSAYPPPRTYLAPLSPRSPQKSYAPHSSYLSAHLPSNPRPRLNSSSPPVGSLEIEQISLLSRREYAAMTSSGSLPPPSKGFYRFDNGLPQKPQAPQSSKSTALCLVTILHPQAQGDPVAAPQILLTRECDPALIASAFVHSFMSGVALSQRSYDVLISRIRSIKR